MNKKKKQYKYRRLLKLSANDEWMLDRLHKSSGMSKSEILRRALATYFSLFDYDEDEK